MFKIILIPVLALTPLLGLIAADAGGDAGKPLALTSIELSPIYQFANTNWHPGQMVTAANFAAKLAAETDPAAVAWKATALSGNGQVDFIPIYGKVENCAVFARLRLIAAAPAKLHLDMGADDGIMVIANGQRVYEHNDERALHFVSDQADVDLVKGDNTVILRVTQGDGGYALRVQAKVIGDAVVTVVK